jgi:hypothetical protein
MLKTRLIATFIIASVLALLPTNGVGQKAAIEQQLLSQYVLTKTEKANSEIATPGTVLVIQKRDLLGQPTSAHLIPVPNNYKDGRIKHGFVGAVLTSGESNTRPFQIGEKFYLVRIEAKDNNIVFKLVSFEAYDGVRYEANLSFQFPKGYLASADVGKIQLTVGEVLTIDAAAAPAAGQEPAIAPIAAPVAPPDAQPPPQSIERGQTPEQVVAVLGKPQKVVKVGNKDIYIYKNLKVTFRDGKVSDVE